MKLLSISLLLTGVAIGFWWIRVGLLAEDHPPLEPAPSVPGAVNAVEESTPLTSPDITRPDTEPVPEDTGHDTVVEASAEQRGAAATSTSPAPVVADTLSRVQALQKRYDEMPSRELRRRGGELYEELERTGVELFRRHYDAGHYEIYPYKFDPQGRRLSAMQSTPQRSPDVASKIFEDKEAGEWHLVVLPRDEHPDYYRDRDEMDWLKRKFEQLEGER